VRGPLRVALGLILLAVACIVLMPAAWLDRPLAAHANGRVRLADAAGTWWRGRGVLASADGAARLAVAWRVMLAPLMTGTLVVDLTPGADNAMPSGTITARRGSIAVRDLRIHAPAAFVPAFVTAQKALTLGGDVELHAPSLSWHDDRVTGAFDATWQRARAVAGPVAVDLGVVSASLAPSGDSLGGIIRNTGGDVTIDGTVGERAGVIDVALALTPTASASEAVRAMLPMLGASDGAGGVHLTWRSGR
jgi:general secretion pathway protein N